MRLLLIRHAETSHNAEARYTGHTDAPLNANGHLQAEQLAEALARESLAAIVTSDLQQARATAAAIARSHALPVQEGPDLRELALGQWEGATKAEIKVRDPLLLKRWKRDHEVGPPGGETLAQLRYRVERAYRRWHARYPDAAALWVTHSGVIGIALCYGLGLDIAHRGQFRRENASITELLVAGGQAILMRANDTAHLRELALARPGI